MFIDMCAGQNKNAPVAAMCMVALQNTRHLNTIDHNFFVPLHTRMECVADYSLIEKKKKNYNIPIQHPHDWMQLVRSVEKQKTIKRTFINLKRYDDGSSLIWRCITWLRYGKNMPMYVSTKLSLNVHDTFKMTSFHRWRQANPVSQPTLTYTGPNQISMEKKKHLLELLPFISPLFHEFYKNLRTKDDVRNILSEVFDNESD
ncbi:hypothetical protein PR048_016661 [Dryococelus australis]|uniref:Uncharacterized protein n=1 Tax=Dryococelus australis TaxID=614101 RepID=A0ABQ9H7K1_9NEOP|nr:hypothetical protein PR048_016661 [Dryococelus australis]